MGAGLVGHGHTLPAKQLRNQTRQHGRHRTEQDEGWPLMRADIVPGGVFPDYELSDHRGKRRTLSELQEGDPLVLVLARGGYCPKDRRQHEGLLQLHWARVRPAWAIGVRPHRALISFCASASAWAFACAST